MLEELKAKIKSLAITYKEVATKKLAEFKSATPEVASADAPQATSAAAPAAPAKAIKASVGKGGTNDKADVIVVQTLLKGKGYPIVVDGDCGNKTIAAIADFQTKKFGKADGRIDPGGSTFKALSATSAVTPPAPPVTPVTPVTPPVTPVTPPANGTVTNVLTATEIKKTGDWATRPDAKKITATPAEVSAFIGKCNQPGSPTQLPVKPRTKVTTFSEEFKYLEGANALITGKSLVPRPAMYAPGTSSGTDITNINKVYGTVVAAHVGENGPLDTPEARKSYADFEAKNIVKVAAPYTLYYDGKPTSSMRLNKKVASSMVAALTEVLAFYGADMIHKLGIDMYGGSFVYRKGRGLTTPSIHAWGCAVDFCAGLNGLKDKGDNALFSQAPYAAFMDIMEKHGWYNQGRGKGSDYMHFQAVCF
jgi:peptidoglycan hydrolase-like protein with peptidoglycan-binding domain